MISGSDWLQGQGVDVKDDLSISTDANYWQCVELPQGRLYPKFGWPRVFAAGNGGAAYIPEGSPGLERHNPGEGYLPVPGDLIIENPTASNVYGHVAVVDRVEGNKIIAVEQNRAGWHTYTYNSSNYSGGYGSIKAIMHAPQNHFSNTDRVGTSVATASNADGRLEVYAVANSGKIYKRYQESPGQSFSDWYAFSGASFPAGAPVTVASNKDGGLEVYAVTNNGKIYKRYQESPGGTFVDWYAFSGASFPAGAPVTVASNKDGRLEVYAVANSGKIYKRYQESPGQSFSDWYAFSGASFPG